MPCSWLKTPDGTVVHINHGRGGGKKKRCKFCRQDYREGKLCDFPVGHGRTCDAEMCSACATTVGAQTTDIGNGIQRLDDTFDLCPIHRGMPLPAKAQSA